LATVAVKLEEGDPPVLSAPAIPLGNSKLTSVAALARMAARLQPLRLRLMAPIPRESVLPYLPWGKHSTWSLLS
jgi:hypothetical protein